MIDNNKNVNDMSDDKNNEDNVYRGYNMHQFLSGIFIDCLAFIYNEFEPGKSNEALDEFLLLSFDIIIFVLFNIKNNLNKI